MSVRGDRYRAMALMYAATNPPMWAMYNAMAVQADAEVAAGAPDDDEMTTADVWAAVRVVGFVALAFVAFWYFFLLS